MQMATCVRVRYGTPFGEMIVWINEDKPKR